MITDLVNQGAFDGRRFDATAAEFRCGQGRQCSKLVDQQYLWQRRLDDELGRQLGAHVLRLNEDFSRGPGTVRRMNADPLIAHETQPTQTLAEMVRADEQLKTSLANITLPVLILHGTADKATTPAGSQFFYDTSQSSDKTLKLYDGYLHDLLNDVGKELVVADITSWIDARLPNSATLVR